MLNQENEGNSEWLEHGFSCGSDGKEFPCHAGDLGWADSPALGNVNPLQYSYPAMILEPKKVKSVIVSIVSPSICHEVMGPDVIIFIF